MTAHPRRAETAQPDATAIMMMDEVHAQQDTFIAIKHKQVTTCFSEEVKTDNRFRKNNKTSNLNWPVSKLLKNVKTKFTYKLKFTSLVYTHTHTLKYTHIF